MSLRQKQEFDAGFALYDALEQGGRNAYDYVYRKVYTSFSKWIKRNNGDEDDAHDVLVDELIRFIDNQKAGGSYKMGSSEILSRLNFYCRQKWKTQLVSKRIKSRVEMPEEYELANTVDVHKDLENKEAVEALANLGDRCRQLLYWFYIEGLSLKEIAEIMGMTENSVKSQKSLCMKELRKHYFGR
jgi:RNA polymerase sigma factor (sigma-70 family)